MELTAAVAEAVVVLVCAESDVDDETGSHRPYAGRHPLPQYSAESPQLPYCEQHPPKILLAHVVKLLFGPHHPFGVMLLGVGEGTTVLVEEADDDDGSHLPYLDMHPAPQNSAESPQELNCEQHCPNTLPEHVVKL